MLPSALPSILTGIRIALGAGWTTLVAAELIAATKGLGFMIQSAAQFLVTDVVIMGILVIARSPSCWSSPSGGSRPCSSLGPAASENAPELPVDTRAHAT
jgi:hypothetical protein